MVQGALVAFGHMRIRVTPKEVFPGIENASNRIQEFSIGALADHLNIGDGVVLYSPNHDFSECTVFAVAEVISVQPEHDTCTLDVRLSSGTINPDSNAKHKWQKNPYLCPDMSKVQKYKLIDFFVQAFNDKSWAERPNQDLSKRYAKFDLTKRTLLPTRGYVYLFKSGDAYKIGMSKDTAQRKKRIEKDKKMNLEFIHEFLSNDYERAEATLHFQFRHCRQGKTEFFELEPDEVQQILAISQMDFPLS
jgi:hypothetical protein